MLRSDWEAKQKEYEDRLRSMGSSEDDIARSCFWCRDTSQCDETCSHCEEDGPIEPVQVIVDALQSGKLPEIVDLLRRTADMISRLRMPDNLVLRAKLRIEVLGLRTTSSVPAITPGLQLKKL